MISNEFLKENNEETSIRDLEGATNKLINDAREIMQEKGWAYKATHKKSALGQWVWTKDDAQIALVGWHGLQPEKWGGGRVIHDLYYSIDYIVKFQTTAFDTENDIVGGFPAEGITTATKAKYEKVLNQMLGIFNRL